MKKVVSFSGGRTSAYLCKLMIEEFGRENVDFVYMDTGAEHPKTYEFIGMVNAELKLNLVCLRIEFSDTLGVGNSYNKVSIDSLKYDLKPFSEMMTKYGTPYIGGMFCTDRMKLTSFKKYCDETYGKNNYETWLGIRSDEPSRYIGDKAVKALRAIDFDDSEMLNMYRGLLLNSGEFDGEFDLWDGMFTDANTGEHLDKKGDIEKLIESSFASKNSKGIRYMAEITDAEKEDVLEFWSEMPFDLEIPEWLGNCVFCPKKSNLKLAAAQRDEPELYLQWLDMLHDDTVRMVDSRTKKLMSDCAINLYDCTFRNRSEEFKLKVLAYNERIYKKAQKIASIRMYRGNQSLEQLIATFDGSTGEEIKGRLRGSKSTETGSCSESCEVFVCEANQGDLFNAN